MPGRLGLIVATALVTAGAIALPLYSAADNGNGNGNGQGNGRGNSSAAQDNGNGNGQGNGEGNGNGNGSTDDGGSIDDSDNGNGVEQVTICHLPPGNPDNDQTIVVGSPAVDAHVDNHDDTMGPCDADTSTTSTPDTSTTSTTSTTTTSTTSTTTSTTMPPVAPSALADVDLGATLGEPVSFNVLTNDLLGDPPAAITANTFDASLLACAGLTFDPLTGDVSGTPTISGVCPFAYVIENSGGFSQAIVVVAIA